MSGETLQVGPFAGGLNTQSDPSSIADVELVDCVNLELDLDNSLVVRSPLRLLDPVSVIGAGRMRMLGIAVFDEIHYFIGSNDDKTFSRTTGAWTEIGTDLKTGAIVQYAGKVWLIPAIGEATDGGNWDPVGGFTADADIPNGSAAAIYKERLFVVPGFEATVNESRLVFSNAGNFGVWGVSDFIDISKGDGQQLVDVKVFKTNLLLFKSQSTYVLSYDGTPFDAIIENINPNVGPSHPNCVVSYENSIFVNQEGRVYELINFDYQQLNIKVPFLPLDQSVPLGTTRLDEVFLSIIGDRLVTRHFNSIFVYGLRTRTWVRWKSADLELHNFGPLIGHGHHAVNRYLAGSSLNTWRSIIEIKAELDASTDERSGIVVTDTFTRNVVDGWGTSDSGHAWVLSGAAANFDVNGTEGTINSTTASIFSAQMGSSLRARNYDATVRVKVDKLAVGGTHLAGINLRYIASSDRYRFELQWPTSGNLVAQIVRTVAAVSTTSSVVTGLTPQTNTYYRIRAQVIEDTLRIKVWLASGSEPIAWDIEVTDTGIAYGVLGVTTDVSVSSTQLPVLFTFDDFSSITFPTDINCLIRTKNYNIGASHVFKRLNWWGVDILTTRRVTARVTPIINVAKITWSFLKINSFKWSQLKGNKWAFPTGGVIFTIDPEIDTGTAVTRKFVKFIMALRYRLVNFQISWPANGTTSEGPAKLFWLVIKTSTKQLVDKKVS